MRTRTRFVILFSAIGLAVLGIGIATLYDAVGGDPAARAPSEAERLLEAAALRSVDESAPVGERLAEASDALIAARALVARSRLLAKDAMVSLALRISAILGAILLLAAAAFALLSRTAARGLEELAKGVLGARRDRSARIPRLDDPDLDAVGRELNALLDLAAEQRERLAEAARLEGWREVASFLAHQLKNPLAAIRLAAQNALIALDRPGRAGTAAECAGIVVAESDRLAALVARFRDLAPEGLGAYDEEGSADLLEVLRACAIRAGTRGAAVSLDAPGPGKLVVACDRGLLEQALWNLFANSIEACTAGAAEISARVEPREGSAVLTLLDSGGPVDPGLVARLGAERVTTKRDGTGLGLLLSRRILAASGGSLEFFASESRGLGARARIPLAEER